MDYKTYLMSTEWRRLRSRIIRSRGGICEQCGSSELLHVHHITYENIFREKDEDLEVLCVSCHRSRHDGWDASHRIKPKTRKPKADRGYVLITKHVLESLKTAKGGYDAQTLKHLGISWPPKKGWAKRLIGRQIPIEDYNRIQVQKTEYDIMRGA